MANTRNIQRRIKSVANTSKITKAMEMVAAAKMRRAVEAVLKTRTYANLSWLTVLNLSQAVNVEHPMLVNSHRNSRDSIATSQDNKNKKKVAIILISSNRGLCGGFNIQTLKAVNKLIADYKEKNVKVRLRGIGKKALNFLNIMK